MPGVRNSTAGVVLEKEEDKPMETERKNVDAETDKP